MQKYEIAFVVMCSANVTDEYELILMILCAKLLNWLDIMQKLLTKDEIEMSIGT